MNEMCGDNRFEIIARAKKHLLDATNIDTSADEMKVLDDFLYRCWQMGWLDRYDTADTPQTEKSDSEYYLELADAVMRGEMSDASANQAWYEYINKKDTPQTETQTETQNSNLTFEKRTMRDCYNCKRYETEGECIECHFEPKADTPQTDERNE